MISFQKTGCIKDFPAYIHPEPHVQRNHGCQSENHYKEGFVGIIFSSSSKINNNNFLEILDAAMKYGANTTIKMLNHATHGK